MMSCALKGATLETLTLSVSKVTGEETEISERCKKLGEHIKSKRPEGAKVGIMSWFCFVGQSCKQ